MEAISQLGKKDSRKVLCAFVKSASKCVVRDMLLAAAELNPGRISGRRHFVCASIGDGDLGDPVPRSRKVLQLWFSACGSDEVSIYEDYEAVGNCIVETRTSMSCFAP